jgi:cytoskeletal protein CcmA (bactofilin family)
MKLEKISAIINEGARLDGSLYFSGDVKISGTITGTIVCKGLISVTETGNLQADIKTNEIHIAGVVTGDIIASNSVKMVKPARYEGVVKTPSLSVESGVIFHGKSESKL